MIEMKMKIREMEKIKSQYQNLENEMNELRSLIIKK